MSFVLLHTPLEIIEAQMLGPARMKEDHVLLALPSRNEYAIKLPSDVFHQRVDALRAALHRLGAERAKLEAELLLLTANGSKGMER